MTYYIQKFKEVLHYKSIVDDLLKKDIEERDRNKLNTCLEALEIMDKKYERAVSGLDFFITEQELQKRRKLLAQKEGMEFKLCEEWKRDVPEADPKNIEYIVTNPEEIFFMIVDELYWKYHPEDQK